MEQILLGTEGNQPFPITQSGVSRHHAKITIDDDGKWILEDLKSTNGTFIRDHKGNMRRISSVNIEPMTFICLGPENSNGCSFYACHIKEGKNYIKEYEYLNDLEDKFDTQLEKIEENIKRQKWIILIINILVVLASLINSVPSDVRMNMLRIAPLFTAAFAVFYDVNEKKKKIASQREKFHQCPNPKCSHVLKTSEIREMRCGKCKNK